MGGINSCCIPERTCECEMVNTSTPKQKGHRRNLSATFNMSLVDEPSTGNSLVNINIANEEELMTLPCISRTVAKNIVDYRNHIGGFRCVEDVALVSGVGATKLTMIRSDIYVVPPAMEEINKGNHENVSYQHDTESDSTIIVSVNSSNVFGLLKVRGIDMTIAKSIVTYRDKHGKFSSLEELMKVKGISLGGLEVMRPYLTVEDLPQLIPKPPQTSNHSHINGNIGKRMLSHSSSVPNHYHVCRSTDSLENLLEVLGPLGKVQDRPKTVRVTLKHKNRHVFRLASWNLERLSTDKARNLGVKDVICMTILENRFGIVAVQELADKDALNEICQELNSPTLPNVKKWSGKRGQWACVVSEATGHMCQGMEYYGFLYDKSQNIELLRSFLIEKVAGKSKPFTSPPFLGIFKVSNAFDCAVVNVHLNTSSVEGEDKERTKQEVDKVLDIVGVQKELKGEKNIVLLGDFNLSPEEKVFDTIRAKDYGSCIAADRFTDISNNNISGSMNCDNIWISKDTQKMYTDVSGVVREGLSSGWIPNGWSWGGVVSDHCPVYAQFYSSPHLDNGGIKADVKFTVGNTVPS